MSRSIYYDWYRTEILQILELVQSSEYDTLVDVREDLEFNNRNRFYELMDFLKSEGLVETQRGPDGGTWLTEDGQRYLDGSDEEGDDVRVPA